MLEESLQAYFGYGEFRPQQQDAVEAALEGRDVLVVMPTGAGKSLCFQLPAALSEGVTLVVSPLIALMRDQVDALNRRPAFAEIGCACLTSLQSPEEQYDLLRKMRQGHLKLVYVAPERFRSGAFMDALKSVKIARFVVDEAHCISEWGHDFRPDYLSLREVVETLGNPPLLAATATATKRVQQSIVANLEMRDPLVLVGGFNRPNLHFSVHRCKSEHEREDKLARALPKLSAMGGSGLIYVATRKQCEQVFETGGRGTGEGRSAGRHVPCRTRCGHPQPDAAGVAGRGASGAGRDQCVWHGNRQARCSVRHPLRLPGQFRELLSGSGPRRAGWPKKAAASFCTTSRTAVPVNGLSTTKRMTVGDVERAFGQIRRHADDEKTARLPKGWGMALDWSEMKGPPGAGGTGTWGPHQTGCPDRRRGGDDSGNRMDFPPDARRQIAADLAKQRAERLRRLDEIVDYCKTPYCRRRTVLDYFGDRQEPPPTSFCCDNCDAPPPDAQAHSACERLPQIPMPSQLDPCRHPFGPAWAWMPCVRRSAKHGSTSSCAVRAALGDKAAAPGILLSAALLPRQHCGGGRQVPRSRCSPRV